jgi:TldD protein
VTSLDGLPLEACADAALAAAASAGAQHVEIRVARTHSEAVRLRDARPEGVSDSADIGLGVRVLVDGVWGFAAVDAVTVDAAWRTADRAVRFARVAAPLARQRVELAPVPVAVGTWLSPFTIDPFTVSMHERIAVLADRSARLLRDGVSHVDATLTMVRESTFLATASGTRVTQEKVRIESDIEGTQIHPGGFESIRTLAPPTASGWEFVVGGAGRTWDWDAELEQLPTLLREKCQAPSVEPGRYTLLIDPSNLWLTIHESVGHATELDRALGYEANYAGTSFATPDLLGNLRYGSELMHVTGDRTADHGLASTGWDDEGVAAGEWDLVRDGVLVGYQLDRAMAAELGFAASNGCAYADSALHVPLQRMPNVSLQPSPDGADLTGLAAGIEDGLLVVGDRSWSIDMQRYNFQFTGQRFHRIRAGRIAEQVRDVAYQSRTPDFWGSLVAVGGPTTYVLGGALNCGKGQPGQVAAVSHGCPAAVFEAVNVLNSRQEAAE